MGHIFSQPVGWQLWLIWLMALNTAAFIFWPRSEGKGVEV